MKQRLDLSKLLVRNFDLSDLSESVCLNQTEHQVRCFFRALDKRGCLIIGDNFC